jgi:anti-sigma B factor antagonist
MEVQIERRDVSEDAVVLAVRGDLDVDGGPSLRDALIETIEDKPGSRVVVDLEAVGFIDSAGLGILLGGLKRARAADGELVLVASGRAVTKLLELTGLTRVFEIHARREAALRKPR